MLSNFRGRKIDFYFGIRSFEVRIGHTTNGFAKVSSTLELGTRNKVDNGSVIALSSKYIYHLCLSVYVFIFGKNGVRSVKRVKESFTFVRISAPEKLKTM